jgi:hypothetical protein
MTQWQGPEREPPKTKAELREMLAEAVRNTQAENKRPRQTKRDQGLKRPYHGEVTSVWNDLLICFHRLAACWSSSQMSLALRSACQQSESTSQLQREMLANVWCGSFASFPRCPL